MNALCFASAVWRLGSRRYVFPRNILHTFSVSNNILGNKPSAYPCLTQTRSIRILLSKPEVESKVLAVCSAYDKIQSDKLTLDSSFIKDLGLDSLDHIEVIMEIENEFRFEISDVDAEKMHTPRDIVEHVYHSITKAEPAK
ncbi:putative acyl carrier protein [Schistosoma mansoni]|uniref:Acyl carrier protein n=1 Tax=Schistosoma mansoni TaxID=6183 RepID=G4VSN6_SCHMA|nr:putative acyl carrier protein [Schistosoma mansoni]|eukprot:XP_018654469.1 putative acyl carrier protein [Schistosoma mansoni]